MANLKDLFVSKVRVKLIQIFLNKPQEMFYVRQLVRETDEEINAVRRELARLEARGLIKSAATSKKALTKYKWGRFPASALNRK